jgi:hypothetical protein
MENNWHLKVPKVLYLYWGTGILPYIRYKTAETFKRLNPEWDIVLYCPALPAPVLTWSTKEQNYEVKCDDYFTALTKLCSAVRYVDMESFGQSNSMSEVHKSDFLRFHLLGEFGGVWSDMDIIYFRPMSDLSVNIEAFKNVDTFVCISHYGHSNGFFMSAPGSKFFKEMELNSIKELTLGKYQSNGVNACNKYFPTIDTIPNAVNLSMDVVYAHDGQHIPDLYNGIVSRFTSRSIGCHWYAGHPLSGEFIKLTNGGINNLPNNIIGHLLDEI